MFGIIIVWWKDDWGFGFEICFIINIFELFDDCGLLDIIVCILDIIVDWVFEEEIVFGFDIIILFLKDCVFVLDEGIIFCIGLIGFWFWFFVWMFLIVLVLDCDVIKIFVVFVCFLVFILMLVFWCLLEDICLEIEVFGILMEIDGGMLFEWICCLICWVILILDDFIIEGGMLFEWICWLIWWLMLILVDFIIFFIGIFIELLKEDILFDDVFLFKRFFVEIWRFFWFLFRKFGGVIFWFFFLILVCIIFLILLLGVFVIWMVWMVFVLLFFFI